MAHATVRAVPDEDDRVEGAGALLRFVGGTPEALAQALESARRDDSTGSEPASASGGASTPGQRTGAVFFAGAVTPAHLEVAHGRGVETVVISLHGAAREVHEHHGDRGSYDAALATLAAARGLSMHTWVATAMTRSTLHVLEALPTFLRARHVARWALVVPSTGDDAEPRFTSLVPRLGLVAPRALAATERALRAGLPAVIVGLPRCTAGTLADRLAPPPNQRGAFAPICDGCDARPDCAGVDAAYLRRFGAGELRPVPRRPGRAAAITDRWAAALRFDWRALSRA